MDQNGFVDFQKQEKEGWSCFEGVLIMIQILVNTDNLEEKFR